MISEYEQTYNSSAKKHTYDVCFYIGLVLFLIQDYLNGSILIPGVVSRELVDNIRIMSFCALFVAIIFGIVFQFYRLKEAAALGIVFAIIMFVEVQYDPLPETTLRMMLLKYRLLPLFTLFFAARKIEFKKMCLVTFITTSLMMIYIVAQRYLGTIPDTYWFDDQRPLNPNRYYLGFNSFAISSIRYILVFMSGIYVWDKYAPKRLGFFPLILLGFGVYFYYMTQTRLSLLIILFAAFLYVVMEFLIPMTRLKKYSAVISPILATIYPLACIAICFISVFLDPSSIIYKITDKIITGRLYLNCRALKEYPLSLRGSIMHFVGFNQAESYFYVDSGYVRTLIETGVIFFLIVIILYSYITVKSFKTEERVMFIWALVICVYSLFNNIFIQLGWNILLLGFWELYDKNPEPVKEERLFRIPFFGIRNIKPNKHI